MSIGSVTDHDRWNVILMSPKYIAIGGLKKDKFAFCNTGYNHKLLLHETLPGTACYPFKHFSNKHHFRSIASWVAWICRHHRQAGMCLGRICGRNICENTSRAFLHVAVCREIIRTIIFAFIFAVS